MIQVEKPTKELLNELKKSFNSKTYDEVIQSLVGKKRISVSRMMRGLRDKRDRF